MCQCPIPGSLHFYSHYLFRAAKIGLCQCPIPGSLHFYVVELSELAMKHEWCVNALSRAHSISTLKVECERIRKRVSMPYPGLTPFLRSCNSIQMQHVLLCQRPIPGSLHFYRHILTVLKNNKKRCQRPIPGSLHFYPHP